MTIPEKNQQLNLHWDGENNYFLFTLFPGYTKRSHTLLSSISSLPSIRLLRLKIHGVRVDILVIFS